MIIESHPGKLANLQLKRYFVTQLNIIANPSFDIKKGLAPKENDLCLSAEMSRIAEDAKQFQIKLNIKLQPSVESNLPYSIVIEIVGVLQSRFTGTDEAIKRLVYVNGSSMIYGTAREIVRASTAFGPYSQILIPAVVFPEPPKPKAAPAEQPPAPAQ